MTSFYHQEYAARIAMLSFAVNERARSKSKQHFALLRDTVLSADHLTDHGCLRLAAPANRASVMVNSRWKSSKVSHWSSKILAYMMETTAPY